MCVIYQKRMAPETVLRSLPVEFFRCCVNYFGIIFHHPVVTGVRSSQIRGLFNPDGHRLNANTLLITIPLKNVLTSAKLAQHPLAAAATESQVRDLIKDDEMKHMVHHFLLGLHCASIVHQLPDVTKVGTNTDAIERLRSDLVPWVRMLDDEGYDEPFLHQMYGPALDIWQKKSFDELNGMFSRAVCDIHTGLNAQVPLDHFRRHTRLSLARTESFPSHSWFTKLRWSRNMLKAKWSFLGQKQPLDTVLVPMLDLVNHSNRPNVAVSVGASSALLGEPAISIHTIAPVEGGAELCRHYNLAMSRAVTLFRYGFLPFDTIAVHEHSFFDEAYGRTMASLEPEPKNRIDAKKAQEQELDRLEGIFRKARQPT